MVGQAFKAQRKTRMNRLTQALDFRSEVSFLHRSVGSSQLHKGSFTQRYSHWWECPQFELQKAIAITFRGATGLRNKAHRDFQGTILELKRRAAVA